MSQAIASLPKWWVHHIESPSPDDLRLGRTECRAIAAAAELNRLEFKTQTAISVETFIHALIDLHDDARARRDGAWPILHISSHGNSDGIQLSDKEFLPWKTLGTWLRNINGAAQGKLILCMSTCNGFAGCRMAMSHSEEALPFYVVIGPTQAVAWSDAAVAFTVLYHHLQKTTSVQDAVSLMGKAAGAECFQFWHGSDARETYRDLSVNQPPQLLGALSQVLTQ